jgi:pantothenate kinase
MCDAVLGLSWYTGDEELFPYLLVNIGSGVSIIKVDGEGQYERVSGSSVGGGTFWGLCRLLTGLKDFDDMLELSAKGNHANVSGQVGAEGVNEGNFAGDWRAFWGECFLGGGGVHLTSA